MTTVRPIRTITTAEAKITTVEVSIRTVTIGQKQMTLSVYKQLYSEPLIDTATTQLRGVPWGKVNYFPGDCKPDHLHIVWQKGSELRRACVYRTLLQLKTDDRSVMLPGTISEVVEEHLTILSDDLNDWVPLLLLTGQPNRVPSFRQSPDERTLWSLTLAGITVDIYASNETRALLNVLLGKSHPAPPFQLGSPGETRAEHLERHRQTLLKEMVKGRPSWDGANLVEMEAEYAASVSAQLNALCDFRTRWHAQYDALDALDHLFIAV